MKTKLLLYFPGPVLPDGRIRSVQRRDQEDRGFDGKFPARDRAQDQGNEGGVRGRGDGAQPGRDGEPDRRLRKDRLPPDHRTQDREGHQAVEARPVYLRIDSG